jgi:2-methylcitrate dehydratase
MEKLVEQIVNYAERISYQDLQPHVVNRAKALILDSIGCGLGGSMSPPGRIVQSVASEVSSLRPATVIGTGDQTSPDVAAFANSVMIRYLDFNDTYLGGGHPSDMLAPVLACVEAANGNGEQAILGVVLAYEVYCGVRESAEKEFTAKGYRPHGNQAAFGPMAAAAVAGKMLDLEREQMGHAISLAAVAHHPPLQGEGQLSHWKACRLANASRVGVFSAMLASRGLTGPELVFGGEEGFFTAIGATFNFEPHIPTEARIMRTHVKAFPCGFHGMGPATSARELHPQLASRLDDIREVRVHATRTSAELMASETRWRPETRETADHSIPFVVSMVLMNGNLEILHFEEERFKWPQVRDFMDKIRVLTPDSYEAEYHRVPAVLVEVELKSGEVLSAETRLPLGHPENPMNEADFERKWRALAEPVLPAKQMDELLDRLWHLDEAANISEILAMTAAPTHSQ